MGRVRGRFSREFSAAFLTIVILPVRYIPAEKGWHATGKFPHAQ